MPMDSSCGAALSYFYLESVVHICTAKASNRNLFVCVHLAKFVVYDSKMNLKISLHTHAA